MIGAPIAHFVYVDQSQAKRKMPRVSIDNRPFCIVRRYSERACRRAIKRRKELDSGEQELQPGTIPYGMGRLNICNYKSWEGNEMAVNQDILSGLMFIIIGAIVLAVGSDYPLGTTFNMGPGYLPMVLGGCLVVIGLVLGGRGAFSAIRDLEPWAIRPLVMICAALLLFAWSIEGFGLVAAAMASMLVAAMGGHEFKWREQVILAAACAAVAAVLFIYFLGLPLWYLPKFLGLGY